MKIANKTSTTTTEKYAITADSKELSDAKQKVLSESKQNVKVPGFRPGKAPLDIIEKYLDPAVLQNEFLNHAVNDLYFKSVEELNLRVVGEPKINISKFVPYSTLEITVEVDIISKVNLPDYTKFDVKKPEIKFSQAQLDITLKDLQLRTAKIKPVSRPAKDGDQVTIDFEGSDGKTKQHLPQATGKDYKLLLGSGSFVKGFEEQMLGLEVGKHKDFSLTFPADYHDVSFQKRKVSFSVEVKDIAEVELPKLDDKFAANFGPFTTFKQFEDELKKQIESDNKQQANRQYEDAILNKLAEATKVELPEGLVELEIEKLKTDAKQNALYRGQTWEEFLASISETEATYDKKVNDLAKSRLRGGLAIGEIASKDGIEVSNSELQTRVNELKKQYPDEQMKAELDEPNNRREVAMRMLSEKVLVHIKRSLTKS